MYNNFNIGDTKTLGKIEEKVELIPREMFTHLLPSFGDIFALFILSFCQSTKLLADIVTIAYSSLEETNILIKKQFLEIKWRNLQKIAKSLKNLGYQDRICTKYMSNKVTKSASYIM